MRVRGILLAYSVGILLVTGMPLPGKLWLIAQCIVLCIGIIAAVLQFMTRRGFLNCSLQMRFQSILRVLYLLLALAMGGAWHHWWAQVKLQERLPIELEGRDMWVTGTVTNLPARNLNAVQFQFDIERSESGFSERRILLNFYGDVDIKVGQRWQLLVRLNRPHGFANPGGFDYEAWLFQQGIAAKGYVRQHANNQLLGLQPTLVGAMRNAVRERMVAAGKALPNLGVLLALSIGDRSQMPTSQWQLMSATGTNHLFVISGLHIGLVTAVVFWIGNFLLRWIPAVALYYPRQKSAAWLGLVAALLYSLLAGFTLPTQRAFIMTAVFVCGALTARPVPAGLRLLIALAFVLTINPLAAMSAGFWLSFLAVSALLVWATGGMNKQSEEGGIVGKIWRRWCQPQLVVFLVLMPVLLSWTGQLALLAPLVNLFAIPLVGMVLVPLCLFAVIMLFVNAEIARWLLSLCDWMLSGVFQLLHLLTTHTEFALVRAPAFSIASLLCLLLAMLLILSPVRRSLRCLAAPLLLPLLLPAPTLVDHAGFDIHILDVGQGLAVIVRTRDHALVYDTGAALSPEFDLGVAVVVPVLRQLGIRQVDTAVVSHFDNDHAGGLEGLLNNMRVEQLFSSNLALANQRLQRTESQAVSSLCEAGSNWQWDEVEFRFLHPREPQADATANDQSCVLQISSAEHAVLLPGDIEAAGERALILGNANLRSDILVVPHHGSNTSSTYAFIKRVDPHYVIFSSGYRNSFGHPTPRIRQRYRELGSTEFITHQTGMVSFAITPGMPLAEPLSYRARHSRYWH